MPYFALSICFLFIFFLIYYEKKTISNVSAGLWIPTIWVIYTASRPISSWLYSGIVYKNDYATGIPEQYDINISSPIDRNFLIIIMILGIIILFNRKVDWSDIKKNKLWIFVFFIYMGLSFVWSQFPEKTIIRWFRGVGDLIMVLVIISENDPFEAINSLIRRSAYVLLPLSLLTIIFFPDISVSYNYDDQLNFVVSWVGITTHKNTLGMVASFSGIFFVINLINNWKNIKMLNRIINVLFILLSLYLLAGAKSATSIIIFIFGIILNIGLSITRKNIKTARRIIVSIIIILLSIQLFYGIASNESFLQNFVGLFGKDVTLTGRTDLWALLIELGLKKPLLGYGFGAFWGGDIVYYIWSKFLWGPLSAHNGYINVFINLGFIGLAFLIIIIIKSYKKIENIFIEDYVYGKTLMIYFILILIHNITETSFASPTTYLWYFFLIIVMSVNRKINLIENKLIV
jgi:exopolysaccharide production protein ExoQ